MNRKIWIAEEKLHVVFAMFKGEETVTEICHRHQVGATQAYRWRDQFLEGGTRTKRNRLVCSYLRLGNVY